jgi:hypothetical protein
METVMTDVPDDFVIPVALDENDHQISVVKCRIKRSRIQSIGEVQTLNLKEAVALLAPSRSRIARANVMKLRAGQYVGVKTEDLSNFVIVNPTSDGDIRWLLSDHPNLAKNVRDIYYVDGVKIRRNTIDLTEGGD